MDRRRFLLSSLAGALATPLAAGAQQPKTIVRIGFLSSSSAERERPRLSAFQQTLRELGYLEGRNIFIEQRYAGGNFQQLPELAGELARIKVDIFVVVGAPASLAARRTTSVIPIVMVGVADPVGIGLVDSLARPGGNITGLSDFNAGVVAKRLELAVGLRLAHDHGSDLGGLAYEQGVAEALHQFVKPQRVAGTLDADGHRAGQRAVELLNGISLVEELLFCYFAGVGMKDGSLLLPGVQITSDDGHESGLLSVSLATVPQPEPTNSGRPFS
jgi:ABC transporter substrate binding protein